MALRRLLFSLGAVCLAWSVVLALTGGFYLEYSFFRVSSRKALPPAAIGALCWVLAFASWEPAQRRERLVAWLGWLNRVGQFWSHQRARRILVLLVLLASGLATVRFGARLTSPLGQRPSSKGNSRLPTYSPGLPIAMAVVARVFGPDAVFWVVPALGLVTLWATFSLGTLVTGPAVGIGAMLLLAASPAFLFLLFEAPMSDIPVTAWWTLALLFIVRGRTRDPMWSGLCAAAALATRPNLAPLLLAVLAAAWLGAHGRRAALRRGATAVLFTTPAFIGICALNKLWYGGWLTSGYGTAGELFTFSNWAPNLQRYATWLIASQTPLILLSCLALLTAERRNSKISQRRLLACLTLAIFITVGTYVFYAVFDDWWYLRFLLPAFPSLLVLTAHVLWYTLERFVARFAALAFAVMIAITCAFTLSFAAAHHVFSSREGSEHYEWVGRTVAAQLPSNAVVLAMQYSGSVSYYSDRSIVRYDFVEPQALPRLLAELEAQGYVLYAALHQSDEQPFRDRFGIGPTDAHISLEPVASHRCCSRVYRVHRRSP